VENSHKSKGGIARIWNATCYSAEGFRAALKHEHAFRQELLLSAALLPIALWLPIVPMERAILVASLLLVLLVELINSAIEAVVDRISSETHELSKRAKDLGSAAVSVSIVIVLVTWATIAGPVAAKLLDPS